MNRRMLGWSDTRTFLPYSWFGECGRQASVDFCRSLRARVNAEQLQCPECSGPLIEQLRASLVDQLPSLAQCHCHDVVLVGRSVGAGEVVYLPGLAATLADAPADTPAGGVPQRRCFDQVILVILGRCDGSATVTATKQASKELPQHACPPPGRFRLDTPAASLFADRWFKPEAAGNVFSSRQRPASRHPARRSAVTPAESTIFQRNP